MKIISLIGFSGSGKTKFISQALSLLQSNLNFKVACIKYVHEHNVDTEGKDSFLYLKAGAVYSLIKNQFNEHALFLTREIDIQDMIKWLQKGPLEINLVFLEGFRKENYPTVLCVKSYDEIDDQLSEKVRMISGIILDRVKVEREYRGIPIRDVGKSFNDFLRIFDIDKSIPKNKN